MCHLDCRGHLKKKTEKSYNKSVHNEPVQFTFHFAAAKTLATFTKICLKLNKTIKSILPGSHFVFF